MKKPILIVIVILLALILLAGLGFIMAMESRETPPADATQGQSAVGTGDQEQPDDPQGSTGGQDAQDPEETEPDELPMMTRPSGGKEPVNTTVPPETTVPTTETSGTETTEDDSYLDEDELPLIPR